MTPSLADACCTVCPALVGAKRLHCGLPTGGAWLHRPAHSSHVVCHWPQAAIRAANSDPGVVFFPPGVYRLTRPLQVTSSSVVIRGAGVRSCCRSHSTGLCCLRLPGTAMAGRHCLPACPALWRQQPPPHCCFCRCTLFVSVQEGSTVIFVPLALADVFPGTWTARPDGEAHCRLLLVACLVHRCCAAVS